MALTGKGYDYPNQYSDAKCWAMEHLELCREREDAVSFLIWNKMCALVKNIGVSWTDPIPVGYIKQIQTNSAANIVMVLNDFRMARKNNENKIMIKRRKWR